MLDGEGARRRQVGCDGDPHTGSLQGPRGLRQWVECEIGASIGLLPRDRLAGAHRHQAGVAEPELVRDGPRGSRQRDAALVARQPVEVRAAFARERFESIEAADLFGFRLNGTVVEMLQTGVLGSLDCAAGTWHDVTDPNLIEITTLDFDLGNSMCLNGAEPNGIDDDGDTTIDNFAEFDCYATVPANGSGDRTVETRELTVTIAGRLASDTSVQATAVTG